MYHFFIPSNLLKEIQECNQPKIQRVLNNSRKVYSELPWAFTVYSGNALEKIKTPSGPRFIWKIESRGNVRLLVLRLFLSHGNGDYDKFKKFDSKTKEYIPPLSESERQEVDAELNRLTAEPCENNQIQLEELSDAEKMFLTCPLNINHNIFFDTIYESEKWTSFINVSEEKFLANIGLSIKTAVEDNMGNNKLGWIEIPNVINKESHSIAAYRQARPGCTGGETDWILFGLLSPGEKAEEKYGTYLNIENPTSRCRRAYPSTFLEDLDNWQEMEQDPNSNFILSDEESAIVAGEPSYPLFLSGRAGSGKSTVLQYLFAEIILRYIQSLDTYPDNEIAPPLYISYSENLIDNAKKLMKSLFSKNHAYIEELHKIGVRDNKEILELLDDNIFCSFRKLVFDTIMSADPDIAESRFNAASHISFSDFKQRWTEHFGKIPGFRNLGPERCWHVIHTYIKGWDSTKFLTPKEYDTIGKNNRTVSLKEYTEVYTKVWEGWYQKLTSAEYWDDLDLVRFCLHPSNGAYSYVTPQFSAIFCDESQDFTRTEIEFILRSSVFSNRFFKSGDPIDSLPFAFAGDEFQTLSPTGFSWDSIRSSFTEKLAEVLNVGIDTVNPPAPRQLQKNYRSTYPIVRLGNRLQLLRETRFNQSSTPQETYFFGNDAPVFFLPDTEDVWTKMKQEDMVLIVPSDEGQPIRNYIDNSPIRDRIDFYDSGAPKNITILNPSQAKGLDYHNVAIYGFGEDIEDLTLSGLLRWFKGERKENAEDIELKYQLNNAYVAVTRAKSHLYIIGDSNARAIWDIAFDGPQQNELQELMFKSLAPNSRSNWSEDAIGLIIDGRASDITDDNTKDFSKMSEDLEERAGILRDRDLMIQAASRYRERKDMTGCNRCQAKAAEMTGDYKEAAHFYTNAGLPIDAAKMYWKAIKADNAMEMIDSIYDVAKGENSPVADIAREIRSAETLSDIKSALLHLTHDIADKDNSERSINVHLINVLLERLREAKIENSNDIKPIVELLQPVINLRLPVKTNIVENILYKNGAYAEFVKLCDVTGQKERNYFRAKIQLNNYPENIAFFPAARWDDWTKRLYDLYSDNQQTPIEVGHDVCIVARAVAENTSDVNELRNWVARGLSLASRTDVELRNILLSSLARLGAEVDSTILETIDAVRLGKTSIPEFTGNIDTKIAKELRYAKNALEIGAGAFNLNDINPKTDKSYFDSHFRNQIQGIFTTPILMSIGEKLEHRGIHIVSVRFYEWAKVKAHKDDKRLFDLLRLRSLELKESEPSLDDRRELGLGPIDDVESIISTARQKVWERIYLYAMTVFAKVDLPKVDPMSNDNSHSETAAEPTIDSTPKTIDEEVSEATSQDSGTPTSTARPTHKAIFSGTFLNFDIRYYFDSKKIVINLHDNPDIRISVKNGKISADEIYLKDGSGRLCVDNIEYNVALKLSQNEIRIEALNLDGSPSGDYLSFEI